MATKQRAETETSFPFKPDLHGKTARPTSVGPHHVNKAQEDPGNPGVDPGKGYAAEIAGINEAAAKAPGGHVAAPEPKAGTGDETGGSKEMRRDAAPRDAPPLRGAAEE